MIQLHYFTRSVATILCSSDNYIWRSEFVTDTVKARNDEHYENLRRKEMKKILLTLLLSLLVSQSIDAELIHEAAI